MVNNRWSMVMGRAGRTLIAQVPRDWGPAGEQVPQGRTRRTPALSGELCVFLRPYVLLSGDVQGRVRTPMEEGRWQRGGASHEPYFFF